MIDWYICPRVPVPVVVVAIVRNSLWSYLMEAVLQGIVDNRLLLAVPGHHSRRVPRSRVRVLFLLGMDMGCSDFLDLGCNPSIGERRLDVSCTWSPVRVLRVLRVLGRVLYFLVLLDCCLLSLSALYHVSSS